MPHIVGSSRIICGLAWALMCLPACGGAAGEIQDVTSPDTVGPPDTDLVDAITDLVGHDLFETLPDTVHGCEDPGWRTYSMVHGVRTSYTRGAPSPSIGQWNDRVRTHRSARYRALILSDLMGRFESVEPFQQFSDDNPDAPFQAVGELERHFDEFETSGSPAKATLVDQEEEPDMLTPRGVRLVGAADGYAAGYYGAFIPFAYTNQDLRLRARLKVRRDGDDARVLLRTKFVFRENVQTITWVISYGDDPGEGIVVDETVGDGFVDIHLPLKEAVLDAFGELFWRESGLEEVELRVEGKAEVVLDLCRLEADAWYEDYIEETERHTDSQILILPGVEIAHTPPRGQWNCVAPASYPGVELPTEDGMADYLSLLGCLVVANRPRASREETPDSTVKHAAAFEAWHPMHPEGYEIDPDWWDAFIARYGPRTALASGAVSRLWQLTATVPHNKVLLPSLQTDALLEAVRKGRLYMVDHADLTAEFWALGPDCERAEMGGGISEPTSLQVKVTCPGDPPVPVAEARVVRVDIPDGSRHLFPLDGSEAGATLDISGWPPSFARLEAVCEKHSDVIGATAARLYTNPIFINTEYF